MWSLLRVQLGSVHGDARFCSGALVVFSHFLLVGYVLFMQETESNSSYNKWWAFLVVRIQEGSKGDRQTWLMHKTRNHRTPWTLSLELDPGWLLGLGSWSQAMFNRVQTKPNQTSAVRKQYMLLPILLKPPYLPLLSAAFLCLMASTPLRRSCGLSTQACHDPH